MPLETLGSILSFAEELESQDREFYEVVAANPECACLGVLFAELADDAARNIDTVQLIRRGSPSEMILEPVQDFRRADFCEACEEAATLSVVEALQTATRLEARADRYYSEAANKLKDVPAVASVLGALGKSRKAHIARLMNVKR